jgi:uncharacterized protein (DUF2164 family)
VTARSTDSPMQIRLSPDRRDRLVAELQGLFASEFDRALSDFQAHRPVDFVIRHLGAPV